MSDNWRRATSLSPSRYIPLSGRAATNEVPRPPPMPNNHSGSVGSYNNSSSGTGYSSAAVSLEAVAGVEQQQQQQARSGYQLLAQFEKEAGLEAEVYRLKNQVRDLSGERNYLAGQIGNTVANTTDVSDLARRNLMDCVDRETRRADEAESNLATVSRENALLQQKLHEESRMTVREDLHRTRDNQALQLENLQLRKDLAFLRNEHDTATKIITDQNQTLNSVTGIMQEETTTHLLQRRQNPVNTVKHHRRTQHHTYHHHHGAGGGHSSSSSSSPSPIVREALDRQEVKELKKKVADLTKSLSESKDLQEMAVEEVEELRAQLATRTKRDVLESVKVQKLQSENTALKSQLHQLQQTKTSVDLIGANNDESPSTNNNNSNSSNSSRLLTTQLIAEKETSSALRKQLKEVKALLKTRQDENESYQDMIQDLQEEVYLLKEAAEKKEIEEEEEVEKKKTTQDPEERDHQKPRKSTAAVPPRSSNLDGENSRGQEEGANFSSLRFIIGVGEKEVGALMPNGSGGGGEKQSSTNSTGNPPVPPVAPPQATQVKTTPDTVGHISGTKTAVEPSSSTAPVTSAEETDKSDPGSAKSGIQVFQDRMKARDEHLKREKEEAKEAQEKAAGLQAFRDRMNARSEQQQQQPSSTPKEEQQGTPTTTPTTTTATTPKPATTGGLGLGLAGVDLSKIPKPGSAAPYVAAAAPPANNN